MYTYIHDYILIHKEMQLQDEAENVTRVCVLFWKDLVLVGMPDSQK